MSRVDFAAVKARVTYNDVLSFLNLEGKKVGGQWRGRCPACNTDNDRSLTLTAGKGAYCFAAKAGGDILWLVSHVRQIGVRDAAQELADHFLNDQPVPQEPAKPAPQAAKENPPKAGAADNVLMPLIYLTSDHEHVAQLGFDADTAKALGIGYASKGMMKGRVAIPLRTETGKLVGYLGLAPSCDVKLPKTLKL